MLFEYLFRGAKTNYLVSKIFFFKIWCKYRQLWSCYKYFVLGNIMMQSKFNLVTLFNIYSFLTAINVGLKDSSQFACMWAMSSQLSSFVCAKSFHFS